MLYCAVYAPKYCRLLLEVDHEGLDYIFVDIDNGNGPIAVFN